MARGTCNYPHSSWAALSAHDKRVWSTYVSTTPGLDFVDGIAPVTMGAIPPGEATMPNQNTAVQRDAEWVSTIICVPGGTEGAEGQPNSVF
eukprot:7084694-Ditylum_brightwellii.AAC.1